MSVIVMYLGNKDVKVYWLLLRRPMSLLLKMYNMIFTTEKEGREYSNGKEKEWLSQNTLAVPTI